jgi:hypothetical protein
MKPFFGGLVAAASPLGDMRRPHRVAECVVRHRGDVLDEEYDDEGEFAARGTKDDAMEGDARAPPAAMAIGDEKPWQVPASSAARQVVAAMMGCI